MQINEQLDEIKREVDFLFNSYSHAQASKDNAFAQWVIQLLFPSIDADQAFRLLSAESEININAYCKDDQSGIFYLICARYAENETEKFGPGIIYGALDTFYQIKNRTSLLTTNTIISESLQAMEDDYELSLIIVLFGVLDETIDSTAFREKYEVTEQELYIYDINTIKERLSSLGDFTKETVKVSFLSPPTTYEGPISAVIGNVNAYKYQELVRGLVPQIYDANLRSPLGARTTKVNRDMADTLASNSAKQSFFWYYNNGITMLCRGLQPSSDDVHIYEVESPRIVNGAQTTNAILSAQLAPDTPVAVMLRIVAALPESTQIQEGTLDLSYTVDDLYIDIAKYTNSQNPIQTPDFRSNEQIQKHLHDRFLQLGWFYERKRGEYRNSSTQIPKSKCILMEDLAQRWYAFDGNPAIAVREKRTLFEERGPYRSIFMRSRPVEAYLAAYLIFDHIEKLLMGDIKKAKEKHSASISEGQRVPIPDRYYLTIGRATKRAVAHMSALVGRALEDQYGSINKDKTLATQVLEAVNREVFVQQIYPELTDALFRTIDSLEKGKTLHNLLSEEESFTELYEFFAYGLEREKNRGRNIITL